MNNNFNQMILENKSNRISEIPFTPYNGCPLLFFNILCFIGSIGGIVIVFIFSILWVIGILLPFAIINFVMFYGYFLLQPNECMVLTLFGTYKGSVKKSGYFWTNPFMSYTTISLRSKNLNTPVIKVNDKIGNPIQIGAVVVWKVDNTAKAIFDVQNYENFVHLQSESAIRNLALSYSYDRSNDNEVSLRGGHEEITRHLINELRDRFSKAGIEVEEARITELSYAPEIANVMLRRQQAEAIIAAREKIVQGAISIVGHAIKSLSDNNIVNLKDEEKSRLVTNMLVVLCSESHVQPTLTTSST
jgi:nucleotide-binding universal stress UspA family protein